LRRSLSQFCRLKAGRILARPAKTVIASVVWTRLRAKTYEALWKRAGPAPQSHDPPYNLIAFDRRRSEEFVAWLRRVVNNTYETLDSDSSLYLWIGADQKNGSPRCRKFMLMNARDGFTSRSFITLRNQRGYGTQKNWMSVRQNCSLHERRSRVHALSTPTFRKLENDITKR